MSLLLQEETNWLSLCWMSEDATHLTCSSEKHQAYSGCLRDTSILSSHLHTFISGRRPRRVPGRSEDRGYVDPQHPRGELSFGLVVSCHTSGRSEHSLKKYTLAPTALPDFLNITSYQHSLLQVAGAATCPPTSKARKGTG